MNEADELADVENPLIEAGKIFHSQLESIEFEECSICNERWFHLEIGPKSGKCRRCAQERTLPGIPKTFSAENDMNPGEQPACLKILNTVEVAAISRICPVLSIYKLKGGASALKGHSISFEQDIGEFARRLPRTPEELPMIVIKAPNQDIPLRANRFHLLEALRWLIANNPFYSEIEIDFHAANMYPDNSTDCLTTIRHFNTENSECEQILDNEEEDDLTETLVPMKVPAETIESLIRTVVLETENQPSVLQWPKRKATPII